LPIADLIVLLRDELLVRVDTDQEKVGEIWKPNTSSREASITARVLAVGPEQHYYTGGERVVLGLFSGVTLALEGIDTEDQVRVLKPEAVLALLPNTLLHADLRVQEVYGLEDVEAAEWCCAPPGRLLVEREEMPLRRGKIHIPEGIRTSTRAHEATVVHTGASVEGFAPGERVLLTTMVLGRSIAFGIHPCRTLWLVTPSQILCKLAAEPEEGQILDNCGEHRLAHWHESPVLTDPVDHAPILDEADPGGLR